ncbi:hypothetical protein F5Y03DRAFT_411214 [Xylaria venustula]|nr:hypothetical protein F5Y03DRAFT_411214 [Xylaria venustula]
MAGHRLNDSAFPQTQQPVYHPWSSERQPQREYEHQQLPTNYGPSDRSSDPAYLEQSAYSGQAGWAGARPYSGAWGYRDATNAPHPPLSREPNSYQSLGPGCSARTYKIIAIPTNSEDSTFLRSYPPVLASFNISRDLFLGFLDNTNRDSTATQPLQVLGKVALVARFAPLPSLQAVGSALSLASKLGGAVASKGHASTVLKTANGAIFESRGLTASVIKIRDLADLTGLPLTRDGVPIFDAQANGDVLSGFSTQQRRIKALEPWIAPLEFYEQLWDSSGSLGGIMDSRRGGRGSQSKQAMIQQDYGERINELDRKEEEAFRRGKDLHKIRQEREKVQRDFRKEQAKLGMVQWQKR